ncbi:Slp family lipoprotein [Ectothiorhodospira lacustris]|uniref:Slp family lipoprotein n=1 Tax=Ectothiorhodospira lacustris TaxID=2899127 RepID=UPI001EE7FA2F|nr:Slp family lipoprotein [Ectothiorhodospira lacustris]MCG5500753.1 Slp family lipoprotein [Ectothiorhodospira lacustris]MCG5510889.1 Slp family lipoprotein [Ectothiorhodospira lacustris]MCG5522565.1 Slp family lipoprotein [Ectothiorhodospira lacustris]
MHDALARKDPAVRARRLLILLLILLLPVGCATGPRFDTGRVDAALTPAGAVRDAQALAGTRVLWGGVIVHARNLADVTEIEVLGYPLGRSQGPDTTRAPQGRFLAHVPGYLETVDFEPGRRLTVSGGLDGTVSGKVGAAPYLYPRVEVDEFHLWPRDHAVPASGSPRFNIGIGVIFRN